jgi:hypothetical protein
MLKLRLAEEGGSAESSGVRKAEDRRDGDGPATARLIGVPGHAVNVDFDAGEHRRVRRERGAREDRLRVACVGPFAHQTLQGRRLEALDGIGAEPVDRDDQDVVGDAALRDRPYGGPRGDRVRRRNRLWRNRLRRPRRADASGAKQRDEEDRAGRQGVDHRERGLSAAAGASRSALSRVLAS